jgi:hypothetical protein
LRYIFSNSPGETTIESIAFNSILFLLGLLISIIFISRNYKLLR